MIRDPLCMKPLIASLSNARASPMLDAGIGFRLLNHLPRERGYEPAREIAASLGMGATAAGERIRRARRASQPPPAFKSTADGRSADAV
jgi:hypothetical protein